MLPRDGKNLAYHKTEGKSPGVIFLGGFRSDMTGTKATYLEKVCQSLNRAFLRFDYSGHGQSDGKFEESGIGQWKQDALDVIDHLTQGPQILVGSSMGGWLMILAALARKERIAGLMGIAAAPDFVDPLVLESLNNEQREDLKNKGICYLKEEESGKTYPLTKKMVQDAKANEILKKPLLLDCPILLVHGLEDKDVPWEYSKRLLDHCTSQNITLTLIKNGDHRLSKEHELKILAQTLKSFFD